MKKFEEFGTSDFVEFLKEVGLTRKYGEKSIFDYKRITKILGCSRRTVIALTVGDMHLQRYHYDLLAFHCGYKQPELLAA